MFPIEVFIPGAFETFFSGTGVVAGDPYSRHPEIEAGAAALREAWQGRTSFRRGRGHTLGLRLTTVEAAAVLADYAETCIHVNLSGDRDDSELAAARTVLTRIEAATEGRVRYDGWNILVDGKKQPL